MKCTNMNCWLKWNFVAYHIYSIHAGLLNGTDTDLAFQNAWSTITMAATYFSDQTEVNPSFFFNPHFSSVFNNLHKSQSSLIKIFHIANSDQLNIKFNQKFV